MNFRLRDFFIACLMVLLFSSFVFSQNSGLVENYVSNETNDDILEINYFYMTGCPACASMKPFLDEMVEKHDIKLNIFEVSTPTNSRLFVKFLENYDVPRSRWGSVPTVFIRNEYFIGYNDDITKSIESLILDDSYVSDANIGDSTKIDTSILGIIPISVNLVGDSFNALFASTVILAFLDSMNICSITVLIFLIIYLISIGSLKRVLKTGLVFTAVIYLFYFLFMLILSSIISMFILDYGFYIRSLVVVLALFAGILLIKDFFFYGKGLSLAVPKSAKPLLEKYLKKATLASTIIFALLASLVELPCTAVFPMVYSTILAEGMIVGFERIVWIAFYNLIYILPLLLIVFGTYFSWINIEDVDSKIQKNKKLLKLFAGIMLVLIALYFAAPFLGL
jgi:thiol-disulfide isomerase/thioredoxin